MSLGGAIFTTMDEGRQCSQDLRTEILPIKIQLKGLQEINSNAL